MLTYTLTSQCTIIHQGIKCTLQASAKILEAIFTGISAYLLSGLIRDNYTFCIRSHYQVRIMCNHNNLS